MRLCRLASFFALSLAVACAPSGDDSGSGDPSSSGGGGSGTPTGSGSGGGSSSGPNGAPSGGFSVKGKVALPNAATTLHTQGGGGGVEKHVSHVMAVTPSSQNPKRVVAEVDGAGAFSLDLDPSRLWVLVFVDASQVGSDMIAGVFRSEGLDTMAPLHTGSVDLGAVSTTGDGAATASLSYTDLLAALGLDAASALFLGSIDDMCLRYVNPDIDGDGVIDALQPNPPSYLLDFHVQFALRTDRSVAIDDMFDAFLPDTVTLNYGGTGIYASFPSSVMAPGWQDTRWASFDETLHYAPNGGMSMGSLVAMPRTNVAAADISVTDNNGSASLGAFAIPGFDMPNGNYRFGAGGKTLTFTNVRTATDAKLAAATDFIMPFIRLVRTNPSCTTACAISTIDYEWRKRTDDGWVLATAEEVAIVAGEQGGFVSIRLDNDMNKNIGFTIPASAVTGTVPWAMAMTPDAATKAAAINATTRDLCHIGLSYDDKLGMRYFGAISDAAGTCGAI